MICNMVSMSEASRNTCLIEDSGVEEEEIGANDSKV